MHPFFIPQCDHARLLVNSRALYLLQQGGRPSHPVLRLPGAYADSVYSHYYTLARQRLGKSKDFGQLSDWYVELGVSFEYVFTVARCGKCQLCAKSRQLDLVNRCRMESELYDTPPVMFTLTYSNKYLPGSPARRATVQERAYHFGQLLYPDVVRFFKRLRRSWDRAGVKHNIRYLVAGEYGSRRGRPHYHVLMWNNPYGADEFHPHLMRRLASDVFRAWSMCEPAGFDFGQAGDGAAAYAAKYVSKQALDRLHRHRPPWYPRPFIHGSIGHGGIGRPFIESRRRFYERNIAVDKFVWTSRHDCSYHEVSIGSYIKGVLHPSVSRQVPVRVKTLYRELCSRLERHARLGTLPVETCQSIASMYRPPQYPNMLPSVRSDQHPPGCWLSRLVLKAKEMPVLNEIMLRLGEYAQEPVEIDIVGYYGYLSVQKQRVDNRGSLAGDEFAAGSRAAAVCSKEKL